jgi:nucleotide-binding universal stress UspA family protein
MPVKSILVATDFSDCSTAAAGYAAELAGQLGASITLVTVVDTGPLLGQWGAAIPLKDAAVQVVANAKKQLEEFGRKHFAGLGKAGWDVREGSPASEILNAAAAADADLIVMGTHGRTGLSRFLVGSTAERVVRTSPVPVTVVPLKSKAK